MVKLNRNRKSENGMNRKTGAFRTEREKNREGKKRNQHFYYAFNFNFEHLVNSCLSMTGYFSLARPLTHTHPLPLSLSGAGLVYKSQRIDHMAT